MEENKFHLTTIKTSLTPNLGLKAGDILDEIQLAFADEVGAPSEWQPIPMSLKAHRIVTRAANRALVGAPLCRNEEYLQMSIKYTIDVFGGADKLRAWPDFLKTPATYLVTNVNQQQRIARKHLLPYIRSRLEEEKKYLDAGRAEDWKRDKPHDSLQWVIDAAPNVKERQPDRLVYRVLHMNVAAVHTTSVTFLNCIFDLATHPHFIDELREEVQGAIEKHGWTKQALDSLRKIDSFMTESQRLSPIASCTYLRGPRSPPECPMSLYLHVYTSANDTGRPPRLHILRRHSRSQRVLRLRPHVRHVHRPRPIPRRLHLRRLSILAST